ncbi:MAG TPA: YbhN family protein [Acidimicrobiales bacterium]|nr:YbhN family protein [Acidimicrobiales bacterium]
MWRIVRLLASIGLALFAVHVIYGQRAELEGATGYLDNLRWPVLAVAAAVELASIVAFAALQRRLLLAGEVNISLPTMAMITFAGNAIQNSLPAGPVWSGVFAFRQFHRRGADEVLAGWVLVGTAALAQIALVVLAVVGLAGAAGTGSGFNLVTVILGLLLLAAIIVGIWSRRNWIARHLVGPLRLSQRLIKRPAGDPCQLVEDLVSRMNAISPTRADWVMAIVYALANWVLDVSCLILAFIAVGAPVPWRALLLTYAASQLAANLPITPGGLGVVEGSLIIGLVAYGGGQEQTVAAVLLYRLLSFWALLPVGWVAWALSNWSLRRREQLRPVERELVPAMAGPGTERGGSA